MVLKSLKFNLLKPAETLLKLLEVFMWSLHEHIHFSPLGVSLALLVTGSPAS